ncbi:hypothetical protein [Enterovirga sp.]|uniref:hypothetical protein n=1 Tax=Enterovirga sp. TaxID=2026350 RepID=UPI002C670F25|nr:hypothetical protein [Enterovirga sp.]HMO30303.1 hypothetical protein [Enterovirga sp.]
MPNVFVRSCLALALALPGGAALAGASSTPFGYAPNPAMMRESPAQLEARIRRSCMSTQAQLQNVPESRVRRGCGCYASRVIRSLDANELMAYRTTGVFNDSARVKAFAALDGCGLRRP